MKPVDRQKRIRVFLSSVCKHLHFLLGDAVLVVLNRLIHRGLRGRFQRLEGGNERVRARAHHGAVNADEVAAPVENRAEVVQAGVENQVEHFRVRVLFHGLQLQGFLVVGVLKPCP